MKRDILNAAALVAGVLILAVGAPLLVQQVRSLPPGSLAARGDQRVVTLEIAGMTCPGCAKTVQERLAGIPGVAAAAVRFEQRRAYVVCDPGVADTALVAAVGHAGSAFSAAVTAR
jgi:copper chaperone CopZ